MVAVDHVWFLDARVGAGDLNGVDVLICLYVYFSS